MEEVSVIEMNGDNAILDALRKGYTNIPYILNVAEGMYGTLIVICSGSVTAEDILRDILSLGEDTDEG